MKKLFYLFLLIGLAVVSCNKPASVPLEQDVIFKAAAFETGFKMSDPGNVCNNDVANYALITIHQTENELGEPVIDGAELVKTVDIFYLNGIMYTNTLKLAPGTWQLTSFLLKNDNDTPGDDSDDIIVYASPDSGSTYASLVPGLPIDFAVGAFMKNEVPLQVICFEPAVYDKFGFTWFAVDVNTVVNNDMFFFGDICTKYFADYAGSIYENQDGDLSHDMPAIFKIKVFKGGNLLNDYSNASWFGQGEPLVVPHPDDPAINGEVFKLKLFILVKSGAGFAYKLFHTWTITDGERVFSGTDDNVVDFVLGSCVPDADLVLAPYMNLPASANVTLQYPSATSYWNITLNDVGDGYDISNGTLAGYCGDYETYITVGNHTFDIFSSLYPQFIPTSFDDQIPVLNNINWLGNHLSNYPGYVWQDFQDAVWIILGQITNPTFPQSTKATQMAADALNYGDDYMPPVGGYAAVLFISQSANKDTRDLQLIFTLVDP